MNKPFAAFDIDGTIVRWQLFHATVMQLVTDGYIPESAGQRINAARDIWQKRGHKESFTAYQRVLVDEYDAALAGMPVAAFDKATETVFETYKDKVYVFSRDLIRSLKEQGYLLFAISGSHYEIVEKFGAYYGFDAVVGTHYEKADGKFTGLEISVGSRNKDASLKELVQKHSATWQDSLAIGDSKSDAAMLALVEQPIAFNPEASLLEIAQAAGWKIVIERKNVVITLEKHGEQYVLA